MKNSNKSAKAMWIMAAMFLLPMFIAGGLFFSDTDWGSTATRNSGELVRPAQPLEAFNLKTLADEDFGLDQVRKKWSLVMVANKECAALCQDAIYKTRQARLAQGKEMSRVRRVLILNQARLTGKQRITYQQQHPDLIVVSGNGEQVKILIHQFGLAETSTEAGHVFMIDPLGNHMMNYKSGFDASGLLQDIRRLLHVSQIG
ncbi:MAG: hypothetical protein OEX12_06390 [Gammaproteobacteria bacterium]|nr:hypothetical protein [Gammaproteobacteria bacterium]